MNDAARLERWYRRILTWYPAEHRRAYGEEMIGVLLASAPDGRRHPRLADLADLVKGGLLARLRPVTGGSPDVGWRDTFAVFSVAAPVASLAYYVVEVTVQLVNLWNSRWGGLLVEPFALQYLLFAAAIVIPPLIALVRRLRWPAIVIAAVLAVLVGYKAVLAFAISQATPYVNMELVWFSIFFALEVVALAISPGSRRGATIMTKRAWVVAAVAGGMAGLLTVTYGIPPLVALTDPVLNVTMLATLVAAAIGLVLALPAPVGARVVLLLAIPAYSAMIAFSGIGAVERNGDGTRYSLELIYLPAFALICLVSVLAWRSHRGSAA